jgi:hypothetical protein
LALSLSKKIQSFGEGEMSTPRVMQAGVPQGSVLSPTLFNMDINDAHRTHGVHLALFAGDTYMRQIARSVFVVR